MRAALIIVGLLLLGAGLWAIFGHGSYTETDTVVQISSAKLTAARNKPIPEWLGIAGIVVGGLTLATGLFKKG